MLGIEPQPLNYRVAPVTACRQFAQHLLNINEVDYRTPILIKLMVIAQANKKTIYQFSYLVPLSHVCEPKYHSWGRCTMALTNMHSDLSNLDYLFIYVIYIMQVLQVASWGVITPVLYFASLGCNYAGTLSCILGCNILHGFFISLTSKGRLWPLKS